MHTSRAGAATARAQARADAGDTEPMPTSAILPPPGDCTRWYWEGRQDGDRQGAHRGYRAGYVAGWRWGMACGCVATLAGGGLCLGLWHAVRALLAWLRTAGWL